MKKKDFVLMVVVENDEEKEVIAPESWLGVVRKEDGCNPQWLDKDGECDVCWWPTYTKPGGPKEADLIKKQAEVDRENWGMLKMERVKFRGKLHDCQTQNITTEDEADQDSGPGNEYQISSSEDEEVGSVLNNRQSPMPKAPEKLFSLPSPPTLQRQVSEPVEVSREDELDFKLETLQQSGSSCRTPSVTPKSTRGSASQDGSGMGSWDGKASSLLAQLPLPDREFQYKLFHLITKQHTEVMNAIRGGGMGGTRMPGALVRSQSMGKKIHTLAEIKAKEEELKADESKRDELIMSLVSTGKMKAKGATASRYMNDLFTEEGLAEMSLTGQKTQKWGIKETSIFGCVFDALKNVHPDSTKTELEGYLMNNILRQAGERVRKKKEKARREAERQQEQEQ